MRKLIVLILLLCATFVTASDPASVISEKVTIQIDAEGRMTRHVDQVVQLNTFRSLRSLGEWFYSFNPELEEVDILKSVTIQKDGTEVPMPENAKLLQTPYGVQHAPDFSGIREMMVSHTGLEPGCRVHFEYRTTDLRPHRLVFVEWMAGQYPIREKAVTIENNMGCAIILNGNVVEAGNTYSVQQQQPVLSGGTFDNPEHRAFVAIEWQDPVQELQDVITAAWKDQDLAYSMEALSLNPDTARPVVRETVRDLLSTRLDTVHLAGNLVGYKLRSADRILRSGYATDLEKVALASVLFTRYGIDHTVILADNTLNGRPLMNEPHYLVMSGFPIYPESFEPGNLSCMPLIGDRPAPPTVDRIVIGGELKEEDGLKGKVSVHIETAGTGPAIGSLAPFDGMKLENARIDLKNGHHMMAQTSATMSKPEHLVQLVDLTDQLFHTGNLARHSLWCTNLTVPRDCELLMDMVLILKDGANMVLPAPRSLSNKWGSSMVEWTLNGNRLRVRYSFHLKAGTAGVPDMEAIRQLTDIIGNQTGRTALLN